MTSNEHLIGFAGLGRLLEAGTDLGTLGSQLEARIARDPRDANAMLDVSTLAFLTGHQPNRPMALQYQRRALEQQQVYRLQPPARSALRVLAVMAPGDMTANTPVDCLVEKSDIELTLLYVLPGRPLPAPLPPHDVVFIAIGESSANQVLFGQLAALGHATPRPIVNDPARIRHLVRDDAARLLVDAPNTLMPVTARVARTTLQAVGRRAASLREIPGVGQFPIIVRPVDSQGGKDLSKVDDADQLASYLAGVPSLEFFIARFIDYRSTDGQFRKCRVALVDGRPFPVHMGISNHWMIHYVNAGMDDNPDKRRDEAEFFATFDTGFAARHRESLAAVHRRIGLDYVSLDCAETTDGRLLIFEVDNAGIIHAFDDPQLYPYKPPAMQRIFAAFRALLLDRANLRAPAA